MASLPGATVLYRLKAGRECRVLGGRCKGRLTMCLWLPIPSFSGIRTVGDRGEPQTLCQISSRLGPLVASDLEGFVGARTQGLRIGYEERAAFSDQLAGF